MYKISDKQVDFILDDIAKKGIETEDVRLNILDHVCCIIENEMTNEMDFTKFYKDTIVRFYKHELREIEEETRELITFKYYYAMRRTLKISAGITVFLCLIGSFFKFQHWPGAGILLLLALSFFGLVFIPLNIVMKYRDEKEKSSRLLMTFGFVQGMILTIGILFKIFHWPGANIIIIGCLLLFTFIFVPVYFITRFKNPDTKFNAVVHTTFMVAGAGLIFGLINTKGNNHIERSVYSTADFQTENINKIEGSNEVLFNDEQRVKNEKVDQIKLITSEMNQVIDNIKANLISKSENISQEKALSMKMSELKHPNDVAIVRKHFANKKGENSYDFLVQSVEKYNKKIQKLNDAGMLRTIDISILEMQETMLSVILMDLSDIKIQVLANENSYLCYQKGMMANN
ncbi:MAG: hypothetical protein ABJG68_07750 [Crocinitomicaceae bacterium]